jgi:protein transport protein SEC31
MVTPQGACRCDCLGDEGEIILLDGAVHAAGHLHTKPITSSRDPLTLVFSEQNSGGLGFEDYGGELDLYDLNIGGTAPEILTTVKTANRFGSLAWSTSGVIAGGMSDGSVLLWKFDDLIAGNVDAFAVIQSHKSEVKALAFCPLIPHKLASGSSDGQVSIIDTSTHPPSSQNLPASSPVEVTKIAWNTQVEHIVAVAHADGLVEVWDLKQLKQWCQLRSPDAVSDIQWNPSEGLHLVTASLDDRNPIIKLWDLRASTSMPLASLRGHSQGILCLDWCPHDDTLMVRYVLCHKNQKKLCTLPFLNWIFECSND